MKLQKYNFQLLNILKLFLIFSTFPLLRMPDRSKYAYIRSAQDIHLYFTWQSEMMIECNRSAKLVTWFISKIYYLKYPRNRYKNFFSIKHAAICNNTNNLIWKIQLLFIFYSKKWFQYSLLNIKFILSG